MTLEISIHALVKRATTIMYKMQRGIKNFNPRPRKEGDRGRNKINLCPTYFNPRPRKEGD